MVNITHKIKGWDESSAEDSNASNFSFLGHLEVPLKFRVGGVVEWKTPIIIIILHSVELSKIELWVD